MSTFSLRAKMGSIAVHCEEALSATGHHFDIEAIRGLLQDPEVQAELVELRKLALIPEKR